MTSGIYIIKNTATCSAYVGSAVNIKGRWASHRHSLRNHKKSPPKLQRAWDKYGEAAFVFDVLATCPKEDLLREEQRWINALKPKYNTRTTAESNFGVKWSDETNAAKGRTKKTLSFRGETLSLTCMAAKYGVTAAALSTRLRRGVELEKALLEPMATYAQRGARGKKPGKPVMRTAFGKTAQLKDLIAEFGVVTYTAAKRRIGLGWDLEKALTTPARTR